MAVIEYIYLGHMLNAIQELALLRIIFSYPDSSTANAL